MRTGSHNAATRKRLRFEGERLMIGVLALSGLVGALHGLPPGLTAVVVVVVGLFVATPKILEVAPQFLSALNERRVTKAIRSEAGALTALRILRPEPPTAALNPTAPDSDVPPGSIGGSSSKSSQTSPAEPRVPPPPL